MNKRILSLVMALVLCISLLPAVTTQASAANYVRPSDEFIQDRIDQLYNWLGGKYFNIGQNTACGAKCSGHGDGCSNCRLLNVVAQDWFQDNFTTKVSVRQFNNTTGYSNSCMAFVWFAEWYIFRANDADTVLRDNSGILYYYGSKNIRKGIETNAKLGDYFRINDHHSVIYLGCDENGIKVLENNRSGGFNCQVTKGTWSWEKLNKISINRFYSKSGNYCSLDHNSASTYKTVQLADGAYVAVCKACNYEYPLGTLNTATKGIYTAKATISGCSAPYQDSGYFCYKKGTKITILGSVKNAYGNTWYKTSSGDWIYSKNMTKTSSLKSTLSVSGETYPSGTLTKGKSFVLSGTISSNYKIKNIKAYVLSNSTGKTALPVYNKTWSKTSYNIRSDGLNQAIAFGKLPAGNYTYVVQATDTSGLTVILIKSPFVVK